MRRAFLFLGLGIAVGAAATYLARRDSTLSTSALDRSRTVVVEDPGSAAELRAVDFLTLVTGSIDTAERAAAYRFAERADPPLLAALARQVAVLPATPSRAFALDVLVTRYAELEPRAAIDLMQELKLPAAARAPIYSAWVRSDPQEALAALADLDATAAAALGLALLEAVGNTERGIAQVLERARHIDALDFRGRAAVAKAENDPAAAVEDALGLPTQAAGKVLARVAALWAARDAPAALARFSEFDDDLLREYLKAAVIREWASRDPEATLAYLVETDPEGQQQAVILGALQAFIELEPARAFAVADRLSGQAAAQLRQIALASLARTAPLDALHQVEALPPGAQREQLLMVVANAYGRSDPDAALVWAQGLIPPSPTLVANVLEGLARVDPDRAIELLFSATPPNEQQRVLMRLVSSRALTAAHTVAVADRLLATPGRGSELSMFANAWAQRDPAAAVPWLVAASGRVPAGVIAQAATALARSDPAAAIEYLDRVPPDLRATWLAAAAGGYAQNNARAAIGWVAQYRGQAGYDAAVATLALRTASEDARGAARLLDSVDWTAAPVASAAATAVATSWASQEPTAAANWAANLADTAVRLKAVPAAVERWASRDWSASRTWVMNLAPGETRDAALVSLLAAAQGTPDAMLIGAFSGPEAQQQRVSEAVQLLAGRNAAAARRLADEYLTDPGLRAAAERLIGPRPAAGNPPVPRR